MSSCGAEEDRLKDQEWGMGGHAFVLLGEFWELEPSERIKGVMI
jgi:hypothetical protein